MFSRSLANRWYGMNRNDFHAWRETFDVDVHTPDIAQLLQDVPQLHALQTNLGMSPGVCCFRKRIISWILLVGGGSLWEI